MPKAAAAGTAHVPGVATPFVTNVAPDPFDARDLLYRPRLDPLPDTLDRRRGRNAFILLQDGSSCTGHAVAAMINTVLANKTGKPPYDLVSPYMLYYLARRYDEYPGEDDAGSSLRGVLKGWWRHGVALQRDWPKLDTHLALDDANLVASCRRRPLGAFYRVDVQRLDDMQSAISELHAVVASGSIHDGWLDPQAERGPHGKVNFVIRKTANPKTIGGHAFALVGYNEIGFLVQNSWGKKWGKGGFATLPYEEWLECAYDAWVARPGVPQTPFERVQLSVDKGGAVNAEAAPQSAVVRKHVLNVGNDGTLSQSGQATSSPAQLREIIAGIEATAARDVVIYVHGELKSESSGLNQVQEQFQWWLNNKVYPIFIVWESGPLETLIDQLSDLVHVPFGADLKGKLIEAADRLVERTCAHVISFGWSQMKQNALAACDPLAALPANDADWLSKPAASLLLLLLKEKIANGLRLHIVAHSAGAVYVNGLLPRLETYGMKAESLSLMAAASTVADFENAVVPRLGTVVDRFTSFTLTDQFELDDTCGPVYHKSLLYLVSRGFERKNGEVPLVGMEHFFTTPLGSGKTLEQTIKAAGRIVVASNSTPAGVDDDSKSTAEHHGDFHDDEPTMTAVLLRILGRPNVTDPKQRYKANSPAIAAAAAPAAALSTAGRVRNARTPIVGGAAATGVVPTSQIERRSRRRKKSAKPALRPQGNPKPRKSS